MMRREEKERLAMAARRGDAAARAELQELCAQAMSDYETRLTLEQIAEISAALNRAARSGELPAGIDPGTIVADLLLARDVRTLDAYALAMSPCALWGISHGGHSGPRAWSIGTFYAEAPDEARAKWATLVRSKMHAGELDL